MTRRHGRPGLCIAIALVVGLAPSCGDRDRTPPSIVLVTLDTVRADHLGSYGHTRDITPFLDELAARGTRFTHAFTASPHTAPAHASILTSLYPEQHRVRRNGETLDASIPNLAASLGGAGFETAAFVSVASLTKLAFGFEVVDHDVPDGRPYRQADETIAAAVRWLAARDSRRPFFLWLHLYDAHEHATTDSVPREWLDEIRARPDPGFDARVARLAAAGIEADVARRHLEVYAAQIAFQDAELRELYRAVGERVAGSVWVVTADHGEGLGDHGHWGHGMLVYDEQIRVPLIVAASDRGRGQVVDRLVRHVDLRPTIEALAGVLPPAQSAIEGRSLLALLEAPDGAWPIERAFAQTPTANPFLERQGWKKGMSLAVQSHTQKYIFNTSRRNEFYELGEDPGEAHNLVASGTSVEKRLTMWLLGEYDRHRRDRRSSAAVVVPTSEELELLERLGYR